MDSFDLDCAHAEGYRAAQRGVPASSNPYPGDHFCHDAWIDGWSDSFRDAGDEYGPQFWLAMFILALVIATIGIGLWALLTKWVG